MREACLRSKLSRLGKWGGSRGKIAGYLHIQNPVSSVRNPASNDIVLLVSASDLNTLHGRAEQSANSYPARSSEPYPFAMTISEKGDIKREETLLADDEHGDDAREDDQLIKQEPADDSRFQQPAPAPWKRVVLLVFLAGMFWLAYSLRRASWERKNKVVYANRCVRYAC